MSSQIEAKHPFLVALSGQLRAARHRSGYTRKQLAQKAGISERHMANLESGVGNASVLVLLQVAQALNCSLSQLLGDVTASSDQWLKLRGLLERADDKVLDQVCQNVAQMLGVSPPSPNRSRQIALIGLRGAGKSTLGLQLAQALGFSFVEVSREIEKLAGGTISEIQSLYGANAYRRYERRAIEAALRRHPEAVLAMPGGVVNDFETYNTLLTQCTTIWLQAKPEDHMGRVMAQGDMRPMVGARQAMSDLRSILGSREALYSKANFHLNTSNQDQRKTAALLLQWVGEYLGLTTVEEVF